MKKTPVKFYRSKAFLIVAGIFVLLIGAYFVLEAVVNRKITAALKQLPKELQLTYSALHTSILNSSLSLDDVAVKYTPEKNTDRDHNISLKRISVNGIHFFKLLSSKKLIIRNIQLEEGKVSIDQILLDKKTTMSEMHPPFQSVEIGELQLTDVVASVHTDHRENILVQGNLNVESIRIDSMEKPFDKNNFHFGQFRAVASNIKYVIPGAYESVQVKGFDIDTRRSALHIDTCRIVPALNKFQIGEKLGHQVDYIESLSSGIDIEKLDVMKLLDKKIIAEKISVRQNRIYAFRDRRLPLDADNKPLPVDYFKTLPFNIRVQHISVGTTNFEYEEQPKEGKETGVLKVLRLKISISPFISHPTTTDVAYMKMKVEGSLMGSGSVTAAMQFPLQKGNEYKVEGAFNELDLTTLNASAENLGRIRIESGMLNSLLFEFNMNEEKSTGKIIGEYHNLVIDKLREKTDEKKVDKFKSFFLKHLIIAKNKDKSLDESKRTGKVDYKRDASRYFSFYLLHSLLVGVKSSFSLGFLLPG